jgi:hypothetical protein
MEYFYQGFFRASEQYVSSFCVSFFIFNMQLMETYNAYRLTGLAFVLLDDNRVRFCLDTFYRGTSTHFIEVHQPIL